ncbi:MAG: hypothetical protein RBS68_12850 [Anaerolineales bacterium]|jgi:hypothetical protein|nr:hypothetical protein [Anaerolineales bacterium]
MTKTSRILSAVALFILPILARYLWTNSFPFLYQPQVTTPNFEQASIPEPPTASAPITRVENGQAAGQVVLIDYAHSNQFVINEIEPFTRALTSRGAITEMYTGEEEIDYYLKYVSAYVIMSPLDPFSPREIRAIERFIANGGRLLVFTDPTRGMAYFDYSFPDIDSANLLLSSTGIAFSSDYLYNLSDNEGNFRNVKFSKFGKHALTDHLKMVVLYGVHSLSTSSATVLLETSPKTLSSLTDQGGKMAAMAVSADGNVLAAGDFTFMTTPFFNVADNALLVERVAEFALAGSHQPSLANFPYIFKGDVTLIALGETQLTANLLASISGLQGIFQQSNIGLKIGSERGENNLLIGTYDDSEEILAILKQYKIVMGDSGQFITLPQIGEVGLPGTGMLFFEPGQNGNTLIMLADSDENLQILLGLFYSPELYGCLIQDNLGICSLGEASSYETDSYEDDYYYEEEPLEEAPLEEPEATATPAG